MAEVGLHTQVKKLVGSGRNWAAEKVRIVIETIMTNILLAEICGSTALEHHLSTSGEIDSFKEEREP